MRQAPLPLTRDLVLIGGGHTHALVLRAWAMKPLPGARLTLIDPGPTTAYSGMLPGYVAGHYRRDQLDIDLVRLARFADARLILGRAEGIDLARREIAVAGRPGIGFDVASIDIGVTSAMPDLPGFAEHAVPAKPLGPFAARWQAFLDDGAPGDVAVLGAGVAGTELALAMAHRLGGTGRKVHLVDRERALRQLPPATARRLREAIRAKGLALHEETRVARIDAEGLELTDGSRLPARFVSGAAGARPHSWLAGTGLALENGFVSVDARLRSSDAGIFAAGDCAHLSHSPRPKAGVFAVREAPVLGHNLRAALSGGTYRRYRPQRDYLKLVSLGDRSALGDRAGLSHAAPWLWTWKDQIDRRFMERFRHLPKPPAPVLPLPRAEGMAEALGPKPLCGGCGAKVGAATLDAALSRLAPPRRDDVRPLPGDDAALLLTGGARQVMTTDHLRAMVLDPVVMTRIAVVHALGDIWAMGAAPQAATLTVVLPRLSDRLAGRSLDEILATAESVLRSAGADLVGGHSTIGEELSLGLAATGLCDREPISLSGGRPGDVLVLTKPLGSGTVMAAEMALDAHGADVADALEIMCQPQDRASAILAGAHAMTDVTGFGLVGHADNIARASGTGLELRLSDLPLMRGAVSLAARGVRSSLFPQNRARLAHVALPESAEAALLFDPQTAGGLLAAVAPGEAPALLDRLRAEGLRAAAVGRLTDRPGQTSIV